MLRNRNQSRKAKKRNATASPAVEKENSEQLSAGLYWTLGIIRPIGYGLLVLFFIDLVDVLTPLDLMNPVWEFQTIGAIVERVPIPLFALVMIFFGERNRRGRIELLILKVLSIVVLLMAVIYFLFIPISILDAVRIDRQNQTEIDSQVQEQIGRIQPVKEQLEQADTEQELELLLNNIVAQGNVPTIENQQQFEDAKEAINSRLVRFETAVRSRAEATQKQQRRTLLKNSVKWNLGALISGILLMGLWQATDWTRRKNK
jgi:ABC-type multidrug transport system fused ATPase/permease subunit